MISWANTCAQDCISLSSYWLVTQNFWIWNEKTHNNSRRNLFPKIAFTIPYHENTTEHCCSYYPFFFFTLFSKSCSLLLIHIIVRPWDTWTLQIHSFELGPNFFRCMDFDRYLVTVLSYLGQISKPLNSLFLKLVNFKRNFCCHRFNQKIVFRISALASKKLHCVIILNSP